ncbi:MAG: anaerobic ribonucleoside-triphosphate reductase activating protein, partial [Lentisphaeria bacterium]|nr:anaerobic ribonucleoside-triphosphate reductase activating protein [Lentisphaeria bacterium]
RMVMAGTADYQFRTTVLESFHTDEQIHGIGEAVRGAKLHVLQPFLPREDLPDPALRTELRTRPDRLQEVAEIMREYVEEVVIRGD